MWTIYFPLTRGNLMEYNLKDMDERYSTNPTVDVSKEYPKKISGAERKRRLKTQKIMAGTWTRQKPKRNASREKNQQKSKRTIADATLNAELISKKVHPDNERVTSSSFSNVNYSENYSWSFSGDRYSLREKLKIEINKSYPEETSQFVKKKRLSGAQKRKLAKEKKNPQSVPVVCQYTRKISAEQFDNLRAPGSTRIPCNKSEIIDLTDDINEIIDLTESKPHTSCNSEDIKMVIMDDRNPQVKLTPEQIDLLQDKLIDYLETDSHSQVNLRFSGTDLAKGMLWITCVNAATVSWLRDVVVRLASMWEDSQLVLLDSQNIIPYRYRISITLEDKDSESSVLRLIGRQNLDLKVANWLLVKQHSYQDGKQSLIYSVDQKSFTALQRLEFKPYYKLGRIICKPLGFDIVETYT